MGKGGLLAIAIVAALSVPQWAGLAGVTADGAEAASRAGSHADKSHSGSLLNDLFAAPVVRDLIVRKVVGGLGAVYDFHSVADLPQLIVFVNQGADSRGVSYLNVAKAELPSTYKGSPVNFRDTPFADGSTAGGADSVAQNGKIPDRDIARAQQALLDLSAMPGVRDLIGKRTISIIAVDYTIPPPELCVVANLDYGSSLEDVERQIPASFEGFPVLLNHSQTFEHANSAIGIFGRDPKRPGRARQSTPQ
jgi:hypothetical protein